MTIGIYKLEFAGLEDWPYVGQSIDIERRYIHHCYDLKAERSNHMLQEAYKISQSDPRLIILEITKVHSLDTREMHWISALDSVNSGLNLTNKVGTSGRGENNLNSVISNKVVEEIFLMIVNNPNKLLTTIAAEYNIDKSIVNAISKGYNHKWIQEKYPAEYSIMLAQSRLGLWDAEHQGIHYPLIKDPNGILYKVTNVQKFAREHGISNSSLHQLLTGKRKSCSKWKLA